ncbi:MAG: hypothetical protein QXG98_03535 [Candidatus Micrarchaeia archaeon]
MKTFWLRPKHCVDARAVGERWLEQQRTFMREHERRSRPGPLVRGVPVRGLEKLEFRGTRCRIIRGNNGVAYAGVLPGARRLGEESWKALLEVVREKTGVAGFMLLKSAPRYGLSEEEVGEVKRLVRAEREDEVVLFACPHAKAWKAFRILLEESRQK